MAYISSLGSTLLVFLVGRVPPLLFLAQGELKLLAVQPTLLPTGQSPWHFRAPGQGQRPQAWPSGLRLPVAGLCRWSLSGAAVLCMGTSLLIPQAWLGRHVLRDSPSQPYVLPLHVLKRSHCFLGPDGGQGCGPESLMWSESCWPPLAHICASMSPSETWGQEVLLYQAVVKVT